MTESRRFVVDPRQVVHETIDGETILIALETGVYYSLSGTGPEIWNLAVAGWPEQALVSEMGGRGPDGADATRRLLDELVAEGLVTEAAPNGHGDLPAAGSSEPFEAPVLKKYTDMEYFLQLDPIHEVEAAGWPHERQDGQSDKTQAA